MFHGTQTQLTKLSDATKVRITNNAWVDVKVGLLIFKHLLTVLCMK